MNKKAFFVLLLIIQTVCCFRIFGEKNTMKNTLEISIFGNTPSYFKSEQIYLIIDDDVFSFDYKFQFSYIRFFVNISQLKIVYNGARKLAISDKRGNVIRTLNKGNYFDFFVHDSSIARIVFFPGRVQVIRANEESYSIYFEIR